MGHKFLSALTIATLSLAGCDTGGTEGKTDSSASGGSGGTTTGGTGGGFGGSGGGSGGSGGTGGGTGGSGGTAGTGGRGGTGGGTGGSGGTGGGGTGGGMAGTGGGGGTGGRSDAAADSGGGGQTGDAGRSDAGAAMPPTGDGGPPVNAEVDTICTPMVRFVNQAGNSAGITRFMTHVPDPTATMQMLSRSICRWIYRKPEDVKRHTTVTLTIDTHNGVANASPSGGSINFSANYIAGIGGNAAAISFEIHGVLAHEGTHVWQYVNGGGGALVEAMADYSRFRTGYDRISRRGRGGSWRDPYTTGGFFIVWVEDKYDKDWGYKVNMGMKSSSFNYANFIMQTFGKSADTLWAEYQAEIR